MPDFNVNVFFFASGSRILQDDYLLDTPDLRAGLDMGAGGLAFEDDAERILISDDFGHLLDEFLVRVPAELRAGRDTEVRYHYSNDTVGVTQKDGQVTFDFSGDRVIRGDRAAVLAALEAAADRLRRLREGA